MTSHLTLIDCLPFLKVPGLEFINLQMDATEGELEHFKSEHGINIHTVQDLSIKNDLEGVTALMQSLDAVVSSRNWIAAFAAATGTRTQLISTLPNAMAMNLDYEPWFPTTSICYRDPGESWEKAVKATAAELIEDFSLSL